jgi:hypothetical protein
MTKGADIMRINQVSEHNNVVMIQLMKYHENCASLLACCILENELSK